MDPEIQAGQPNQHRQEHRPPHEVEFLPPCSGRGRQQQPNGQERCRGKGRMAAGKTHVARWHQAKCQIRSLTIKKFLQSHAHQRCPQHGDQQQRDEIPPPPDSQPPSREQGNERQQSGTPQRGDVAHHPLQRLRTNRRRQVSRLPQRDQNRPVEFRRRPFAHLVRQFQKSPTTSNHHEKSGQRPRLK